MVLEEKDVDYKGSISYSSKNYNKKVINNFLNDDNNDTKVNYRTFYLL